MNKSPKKYKQIKSLKEKHGRLVVSLNASIDIPKGPPLTSRASERQAELLTTQVESTDKLMKIGRGHINMLLSNDNYRSRRFLASQENLGFGRNNP